MTLSLAYYCYQAIVQAIIIQMFCFQLVLTVLLLKTDMCELKGNPLGETQGNISNRFAYPHQEGCKFTGNLANQTLFVVCLLPLQKQYMKPSLGGSQWEDLRSREILLQAWVQGEGYCPNNCFQRVCTQVIHRALNVRWNVNTINRSGEMTCVLNRH